ncbi:uncharacterized isomerase BH0283 isoform X2 [Capsicum annuum]|uniref:uncharacterized isomerase BH0283 isoform X2 n=1 Tax=Capsicum annuum TaxID=4072 RepID=UPI001FB15783|nr:uncharacterized isomerase BH0283 isoform X2 [Capsicum annuum]
MAKKLVKYVVVDAFTDTAFKGNPAAVCVLEEEKDDKWLQSVAAEFNVSQTAYLTSLNEVNEPTKTNPRFGLRWFTPVNEVDLCGHATLGAAHFLFANGLVKTDIVEFSTRSGILTAKRVPEAKASNSQDDEPTGYSIELDFPVLQVGTTNFTDIPTISKSLNGASAVEINETSKGDLFDPVCGSAHCALTPYWSKKLGKCEFVALQASPRGGVLNLRLDEEKQRVFLRGKAVAVMEGSLLV